MFGKHKRTRRDLERRGKRAPATVVEIAATGWETEHTGWNIPGHASGGREIVRKTKLRVRPADEPEFEVEQRIRYGAETRMVPKAGEEIEVLYDPDDHEKVVVAPLTPEQEQARTMAALSDAKIGFSVGGSPRPASAEDREQAMQQHEQAMNQAQAMLDQMNSMTGGTPVAPASAGNIAELERLQALRDKGEMSDSEFEAAKAKLLGDG